jgi:hypothetical protein
MEKNDFDDELSLEEEEDDDEFLDELDLDD